MTTKGDYRNAAIRDINNGLIVDFIFMMLPFVVSGILSAVRGTLMDFLLSASWSLSAAILLGRSISKFWVSVLQAKRKVNAQYANLITTFLALGLFVALVTHAAITFSTPVPVWLYWLQTAVFLASIIQFFVIGQAREILLANLSI